MTPQIVFLLLIFIGMLINAYSHGKSKDGYNNFWISLMSSILLLLILYWGGFFDVMCK